MRGVPVSMAFVYFVKIFLMFSGFVCHGERIIVSKGSSFDGKPVPLQKPHLSNDYEISSELFDSNLSNYMIFFYDGGNITGLWRLTRFWSSVEMIIQSEDEGFNMELVEMHHIKYKNGHHSTVDAGLQYIPDYHNHFIYNVHYILDALWHIIFNYTMISVDIKYIESIKINPIGQHFVKVCYHGSNATTIFSISLKESIIDYHFPLCLLFGVLLLLFAHPWARNINFLYGTTYNIVGILLSPFTSVYRICEKIKNVHVFCVALFAGWVFIIFVILWVIEQDWYYKGMYIIACLILEIFMGSTEYMQSNSDENTTFKRLNWIIGIALIFSSTQLLEFSIILPILSYICINYPMLVYRVITKSITRQ